MDKIAWLKQVLREDAVPFYSNEELEFYLRENGDDHKAAAYRLLLIIEIKQHLLFAQHIKAKLSAEFIILQLKM